MPRLVDAAESMMLNRQRQWLRCSVVGDVAPSAAEDQRRSEKLFPKGLRVLLVDDDTVCLAVLEKMLLQCDYNVTPCTRVSQAISLVMEKRHRFDIVMSDVYLPNADGFRLLEAVGIGFGVPVIMMSVTSETDVVMRSIRGGACNHLVKPIRMEELHTIWQHVVRSHGQQNHRHNLQKSHGRVWGESTTSKKRKHGCGQVVQAINKTGRVHWSDQLHRKFVKAVNQTGVDNAAPKKILEIMNIEGLTREKVASHLQKYRLYLNRLRGSIPEPRPVASFQAATDGKSGGTMQILPRGKTSPSPSSALKAFPSRLQLVRGLNRATLKLHQQFQDNEHKLAANRAQRLRRLAAAAAAPSYRSTNVHFDQVYESGAEFHIITHVGRLKKNPQNGGGQRATPCSVDFAELDKAKLPPMPFAPSTDEHQVEKPWRTAKTLEESNDGKQNAQKSTDKPRNIDEEEFQFINFVEEEFQGVTFPLIHDQSMPTLTAAGDLPEEYVMLANYFLSQQVG